MTFISMAAPVHQTDNIEELIAANFSRNNMFWNQGRLCYFGKRTFLMNPDTAEFTCTLHLILCSYNNMFILQRWKHLPCTLFKGNVSTANSLSFQTSLCVLMLFAWAQNVSSDETPGRPQCAPHPPTWPYLLLLGEGGRSTCHFRLDTGSPDSSCGFIMLPPLCLFCISIVSFLWLCKRST